MRKSAWYLSLLLLSACTAPSGQEKAAAKAGALPDDSVYMRELRLQRRQKDNAFAGQGGSPFHDLPGDFTGLKYYPPSLKWRIRAGWDKKPSGRAASITDTKGKPRSYADAGTLNFSVDGVACRLPVYFEDLDRQILFIMFRDKTNGSETYGGGRYLEFRVPKDGGDSLWVDFNTAYNPWCHYNHGYACPLVPADHRLPVRVEAGEMKYPVAE